MFMLTRAFQRKARLLWERFEKEFPHVEKKMLVDVFENFFLRKEGDGYPAANYFLEYAQILRKKL